MSLQNRLTALAQAVGDDMGELLSRAKFLKPVEKVEEADIDLTQPYPDTGSELVNGSRVLLVGQNPTSELGVYTWTLTLSSPRQGMLTRAEPLENNTIVPYIRGGRTLNFSLWAVSSWVDRGATVWGIARMRAPSNVVRGPIADRFPAGSSNKGYFWIDDATGALSYSDGTAWHNVGGSNGTASVQPVQIKRTAGSGQLRSANQWEPVWLNATEYDTTQTSHPAHQIVVPKTGRYKLHAFAAWDSNQTGDRWLEIRRNGIGFPGGVNNAFYVPSGGKYLHVTAEGTLNQGDVLTLYGYNAYTGSVMQILSSSLAIEEIGSPVAVSPARRVKGKVNANGTKAAGNGFTVAYTPGRIVNGDFTITFDKPFAVPPVVTAIASGGTGPVLIKHYSAPTQNSVRLLMLRTDTNTYVDEPFDFIAEDPGLGMEATMDVEPWRFVGAAGQPAFENSWVNNAADRRARFRKTPDGKVHLQGVVKTGVSGSKIFTLPEGYRPSASAGNGNVGNGEAWLVVAGGGGGTGQVIIDPFGGVYAFNVGTGNVSAYVFLNGIEFFTD